VKLEISVSVTIFLAVIWWYYGAQGGCWGCPVKFVVSTSRWFRRTRTHGEVGERSVSTKFYFYSKVYHFDGVPSEHQCTWSAMGC